MKKEKNRKSSPKREKFEKIFYPILYFVLIVGFVCCSCFTFDKLYYEQIYVSGSSMNPTLIGDGTSTDGYSHYGKADKSRRCIESLERFDVVITFYPSDWDENEEVYKIKRIWGFPGETLTIDYNKNIEYVFTVKQTNGNEIKYTAPINTKNSTAQFTNGKKSFYITDRAKQGTRARMQSFKLEKDEYFLMGDNWTSSLDSYINRIEKSKSSYINVSHIQGKVVEILGMAQIRDGLLINKKRIYGMYNF